MRASVSKDSHHSYKVLLPFIDGEKHVVDKLVFSQCKSHIDSGVDIAAGAIKIFNRFNCAADAFRRVVSAAVAFENTADFLKAELSSLINKDVAISILGRGLSTGIELEYADPETLKNAFLHRTK